MHEAIDSVDCVAYLVKQGNVDVNALKRGDWTPLMSAGNGMMMMAYVSLTCILALKGNLDIIKILEQAGAQLDRITKDGRTALHLAIQNGNDQIQATTFAYCCVYRSRGNCSISC